MEQLQRAALRLDAERRTLAQALGVDPDTLEIDRLLGERPELRRVVEALDATVVEIRELGAELKDVRLGLVDFPSRIEGEEACLCWQFGEDAIRYWHRPSEGFAGRRLLPGASPAPQLQ